MIIGVLRNEKEDIVIVEKKIRQEAALYTDETVKIAYLSTKKECEDFLTGQYLADIICIDVSVGDGVQLAESIRNAYAKSAIVIVATPSMSPMQYMKPTILASALLLKPLSEDMVEQVIHSIFEHFIIESNDKEMFIVDTRDDKQRIPYEQILYFESREKKVYVCTELQEFGFYETLDHLEDVLREKFIRCHRSYLVNKNQIKNVILSKNLLRLKSGIELPLSRSYKGILKEFLEI